MAFHINSIGLFGDSSENTWYFFWGRFSDVAYLMKVIRYEFCSINACLVCSEFSGVDSLYVGLAEILQDVRVSEFV